MLNHEKRQKEMRRERGGSEHNSVVSNHLTEKEKEIMNGAIGRQKYLEPEENDEGDEPDENGPKPILPYTSMFVFRSEDQIRVACHYIVNLRYFEATILTIIILSSFTLAAEDPVHR